MVYKLETKPFQLAVVILGFGWLISQFMENPLEIFIYLGAFLGTVAFANTTWLNHRINKTQEVLERRGICDPVDFIVNDEIRRLIQGSSSEQIRKDVPPERRKLEENAQKISDKYSRMYEHQTEDMDFSEMTDEQIKQFQKDIRGQIRFERGYSVFVWIVVLLTILGISYLF
ncbi:MAG: hypothetical protein Q8Q89_04445 [bacterium]|nr:hypothetical protein [bacterium]